MVTKSRYLNYRSLPVSSNWSGYSPLTSFIITFLPANTHLTGSLRPFCIHNRDGYAEKNPEQTNKQTKKMAEDSEILRWAPWTGQRGSMQQRAFPKAPQYFRAPVRAACTPVLPPEGKREAEPMCKPVPVLHTKPVPELHTKPVSATSTRPVPVPSTKPVPVSRTKSVVMPEPEFLPRRLHKLGLNS